MHKIVTTTTFTRWRNFKSNDTASSVKAFQTTNIETVAGVHMQCFYCRMAYDSLRAGSQLINRYNSFVKVN